MTQAAELAIAVLMQEGLIEKSGAGYAFKTNLPEETRSLTQEPKVSEGQIVVGGGRLPWLVDREPVKGEYMPTTKQGRVFCAVKMALGLDWKDRAYDAAMYKRSARALNQLVDAFTDEQECAEFVLSFGDQMKEAGISNWSIDAIVRSAYNTKGQRERMK